RTGYRAPTTAHRARLLSAVDGRMSVADLANRFREQEPALDVRAELGALQRQGFVCFRFPTDRIPAA
ncbi:MAG TPA: hypothetical protein VF163_00810, partial [Micromonosporaceae bacterium]